MENGNKLFVIDLTIECILDIKSHSMRFLISKGDSQETVVVKMSKTIVIEDDIDPNIGNAYFHKPSNLSASNNYNYKVSSQESEYNCFDEKSLIRAIAISIAGKAVHLTAYEEPKDKLIKDLDPKKFIHVKTKNKAWFKNWITKIINKKITSFVLYANKSIMGAMDINHVNLIKTALGSFSIKRWHSSECEVVKNILSHKIFYDTSLDKFKLKFPNRISVKCLKYSFVECGQLKFIREIAEEDPMVFDHWEEALTLRLKDNFSHVLSSIVKYGNIPIPSDFIDSIYMITDKVKIDDRRDFVQALGISKCVFDRANNTFGLLSINYEKVNRFSDIETTVDLFNSIYSSYYNNKDSYIKKACEHVDSRKKAEKKQKSKQHKIKVESMISLYPSCVDGFWDKIIEEENFIVINKKIEESYEDYF